MLLVLLLLLQQFIGGLLGEKLDSDPLVLHSYLGLASNVGSRHGITNAPRSILIFLDRADELVAGLNVNLTSFNDFL